MPARPFKHCRLFRWWQIPVALILSVMISLSQPVFTGCFRGEGFRLMGNIVFCRQNRAETAPLDVDWGVVKRGATLGNGMPQDEDWLEHGSVDGEVPDLQEEGDFDGEGGLVSSAERGLTANRVRESEQRLERGSLVLFPGENIELGSRDNHVELPSKAESVRAKTLRSPEDAEIGRGPEILQLESATGEGLQEVERGGNGVEKGALGRIESGEGYRPAHAEKGRGKGELIDEVSKRSERLRLEQEGGQKGGDGMRRGTEKVTEEGERIETEGREKEEVRKRGELEGRAEEKEPTTARGEEFDESDMEAEDEGGGPFMRGVAASESNPESGLLSTKEGENGETTGREGVQSRARLELTSRAAEEYRPHPSCRPHELVYVYELPSEYNVALFGPSCGAGYLAFQQARNACVIYSPEFGGIGPRLTGTETEFLTGIGSPADSWADTGQFGLEVMFHQYMRDAYPCRTSRGEDAAAFYVPLYTGMLHLNRTVHCGIDTCPEVSPLGWAGRLLGAYLNKMPWLRRHKGRDHITTMGRCTYDGLQDDTCCTNGLLKTKHTKRFVIMGIESNDITSQERQVSIPYPTCFHPSTPEELSTHQQLILSANRTVLINFTGQLERDALWQGRNLRRKIAEQCAAQPGDCELVNCGTDCHCTTVLGGQLRAHFCLQPPGDTPTRRSLFDSLQGGCIPVLFQRASAYDEYTSFLPADESSYSVFIPEGDVIWGGADIIEALRRIPEAELERKRAVIASMLPAISYEDHGRARQRARHAAAGPRESFTETLLNPLGERSAYGVALAEALRRVERALDAAAAEASS